jgi:pimeloyl-ACP methyl ester carboxylesterase
LRFLQLPLIVLMVFSAGLIPARLPKPGATGTINPICCQIWRNDPGAQITDTLATSDLQRPPDEIRPIDKLEFLPGFQDGWACSISGLIQPPVTGNYRFQIASHDSGLLFLSTDESSTNRRFIAETPAATDLHNYRYYSAQNSEAIQLIAGHRYFIQTIVKSLPGGSGCVSIAWTLPTGKQQGPIPAEFFSPASGAAPPPSLRVNQFSLSLKPEDAPTTQPGLHRFIRGAQIQVNGKSDEMSYLMDLPKEFSTTADPKPMLVFLHGNNRQGYDTLGLEQTGPIHDLEMNPQLANWLPMIILAPQLPPDYRWDTPGAAQAVNALVHQLCLRYSWIDRKRIYLTGLSMGGKGTWLTLENSPDTYAAAVPISAVDVRPDQAPQTLKDLPELHIACGSEDGGFTAGSHRMYEALKPVLGDRVQFTQFDHEGHSIWDHFYASQAFYEHLLKFSR